MRLEHMHFILKYILWNQMIQHREKEKLYRFYKEKKYLWLVYS